LELCDVTLCLVIIALFTLNQAIVDLAYYGALSGTSMALLTPDLSESFSSFTTVQFFVDHGLIVTAVLYLVWSKQARPRPWSVGRAMLALNTGVHSFRSGTRRVMLLLKLCCVEGDHKLSC
jgi:hypothetical integral membrane protein (TIGR02206 family)